MRPLVRFIRREPPAIAAFVVMAVVLGAWLSTTARVDVSSIAIIISQVLPLAMAATGMSIVLFAKGIDLSVGATLALTNVLLAQLSGQGVPVLAALAVAVVVALVAGAINGILIGYADLPPLVITLGTSSILSGIALYVLPQPGGSVPVWFSNIPLLLIGPVPFSLVLLVGVPLLFWYPVRRSRLGIAILAVGGDEVSAYTSGIATRRVRGLSYVGSAFFASMGGVFMTTTSMSGDPKIGAPFTLNAIAAAVLGGCLLSGGRGTVSGAVAGAVTLQLIGNLLFSLGLNGYWRYVVIGIILVAALGLPYVIGIVRRNLAASRGRTST